MSFVFFFSAHLNYLCLFFPHPISVLSPTLALFPFLHTKNTLTHTTIEIPKVLRPCHFIHFGIEFLDSRQDLRFENEKKCSIMSVSLCGSVCLCKCAFSSAIICFEFFDVHRSIHALSLSHTHSHIFVRFALLLCAFAPSLSHSLFAHVRLLCVYFVCLIPSSFSSSYFSYYCQKRHTSTHTEMCMCTVIASHRWPIGWRCSPM